MYTQMPAAAARTGIHLVAVLQLAAPSPASARVQSFEAGRAADRPHEVNTIYDRLTDSTRVSVALKSSSRPFGRGSRVWLDVSFTHAGPRLTVPPHSVVLSLVSFTPARGGWAFARPRRLRVESGESVQLELPAAHYEKFPAHLFDAGRRELLAFRIPIGQFVAMSAEPELELKTGNARIRLRGRAMDVLGDVARRLMPASTEVR